MSVAFILNPGYNTINNVHHTFWDQDLDNIKNTSLNQELAVSTSVSAPNHIVTGGTLPAQLYMQPDGITLATDAPQFQAPILLAPTSKLQLVDEFEPTTGITFSKDIHMTYDATASNIDGVGTLTCDTLKYTTLDPAITPGVPSTWSQYPATSNVDLHGFKLSDSTRSDVFISQPITCISTVDNGNSTFGNSLNNSNSQTSFNVGTNISKTGSRTGGISVTPSNKTGAAGYYNNPGSVALTCDGGDMQLQTYGTGKIRLVYDNFAKAITVNQAGAMSFNSTFAAGVPVDGSFGTSGQIIASRGSALPPSWVDAPSASNWSSYPAGSNVDMGGYSLSNTSSIALRSSDPSNALVVLRYRYPADNVYNRIDFLDPGASVDGSIGYAGPAPTATKWDHAGNSVLTRTNNRIVSSGSSFAITSPGSTKALVRNSSGAVSFDSTFDPTTPSYLFGTSGQLLSSNGDAAAPVWVNAPGDPSTWSEYPATQQADLATYGFKSSSNTFNTNNGFTIDGQYSDIYANSSSNADTDNIALSMTIGTTGQTYSQCRLQCNSTLQAVKTDRGFQFEAGSSALTSGNNGDLVFQSGDNNPAATANIRFAYSGSSKAYTINPSGALAFDADWNGTSPIIEGSYGTAGQIIQSNGSSAAPSWVSPGASSSYVFYVSKSGSDSNSGKVNYPLLTISAAITAATALYPQQVAIIIAPGVYSGSLSITRPNITLLGYSPSSQQNLLTQIVGNISIACTASQDLYYSQVGIFNLHISGSIIDTSTVVHTLNIEASRIANNGQVFWQNSSADNRTRLEQVTLLQASTGAGTAPLMQFSSGTATLGLLDVTGRDNAPLLQFDGTALLSVCALSTFDSATASATAAPIVYIALANGGTAPYTQKAFAFGYNSFSYSTSTARAFSSGKNCGIVTNSTTGNARVIITYNAFNLLLCDATCFCVSDVNKSTPAKATSVNFFSNCSTYLATGIDTLTGNKSTFAAVA